MSVGGRRPAEGDVIERLKRLRARYEPAVTRILLLGFFVTGLVAQFVKPVGHRPGTGSPGTQSPVERPFLCDLTGTGGGVCSSMAGRRRKGPAPWLTDLRGHRAAPHGRHPPE